MFPEYIKMLKSRLALGSLKEFQEGLWGKKCFPNGPEIQDKLSLSQFCWRTRITLQNGAANPVSSFSVAFTVTSITGPDGFMMWTDKPWRVKLAHRNPFSAWPMAGFKRGDRGGYPSPAPCKLPLSHRAHIQYNQLPNQLLDTWKWITIYQFAFSLKGRKRSQSRFGVEISKHLSHIEITHWGFIDTIIKSYSPYILGFLPSTKGKKSQHNKTCATDSEMILPEHLLQISECLFIFIVALGRGLN